MIVGVCALKLKLYSSNSLKEKRHITKSIIGRIQSRFNVSIAEIGLNDNWQTSIIGFSCVTNDTKHANQIISNVIKFIDGDSRVEIIDYDIEIM
ncbi:hypothetical protein EDD65_10372 [Keratinibaculum paraultunense]|uniref:DUF503 domain-containing protein n=1 Tax=Keratinibaculum paraultunense TaxID=1278232 RepID=A0A4V2UUH3_9FIRM|nr:DUF503 domain-containing protein [Keratinibaculum paraultunense]QQY80253.1 DUF503 domain-containing protein [Keratinibaculum paraultunense]TCS90766.1 hypothetical protein EDD65_10372 [Keratinibaculum paraultunense]